MYYNVNLEPGDWLMFPGGGPVKVESVDKINGKVIVNGMSNMVQVFGKDLEPIPLTRDVLHKLDFEYVNDEEGGCYESEFFDLYHIINNTYSVGCTMMRVTYVHELQHALRLCENYKEIKL